MYELCCDMIDLLINMSEIYGQPNENSSGRSLVDDDDEDRDDEDGDDDINDEREHLHDDEREQDWNLTGQQNGYEENSHPVNGSRSNSFVQSQ